MTSRYRKQKRTARASHRRNRDTYADSKPPDVHAGPTPQVVPERPQRST